MGDMNDVISGRSSMRRARPLFLRINTWRRREEEEREPGIRPGRDWGAYNNEERVPGGRGNFIFEGETGHILHQKINQLDHNPKPNPAV